MEPVQIAVLLSHSAPRSGQAWSALPDAPVVLEVAKPQPVRAATASVLMRLANRVAPAPAPAC